MTRAYHPQTNGIIERLHSTHHKEGSGNEETLGKSSTVCNQVDASHRHWYFPLRVYIWVGNTEPGISTLIFPQLTSQQAKYVGKNKAISLVHYTSPKQIKPPAMLTHEKHIGIAYADVIAREVSFKAAQEADTLWLNSQSEGTEAIEWNGFNNQLSRTQGILKPATNYMFGPLIDAPPSHPDTILTTLTYMQRSLTDMGMKYVHLSMDMQLFAVTKQVCWNQPNQFQNMITHPGGMHIIDVLEIS